MYFSVIYLTALSSLICTTNVHTKETINTREKGLDCGFLRKFTSIRNVLLPLSSTSSDWFNSCLYVLVSIEFLQTSNTVPFFSCFSIVLVVCLESITIVSKVSPKHATVSTREIVLTFFYITLWHKGEREDILVSFAIESISSKFANIRNWSTSATENDVESSKTTIAVSIPRWS